METNIPKLECGKCTVVFAEKATGILLTTEGHRYLGEGEFYRVFDSEREADAFAVAYVQGKPEVECSIRDSEGKYLKFVSQ
jgi:hypothetical protein